MCEGRLAGLVPSRPKGSWKHLYLFKSFAHFDKTFTCLSRQVKFLEDRGWQQQLEEYVVCSFVCFHSNRDISICLLWECMCAHIYVCVREKPESKQGRIPDSFNKEDIISSFSLWASINLPKSRGCGGVPRQGLLAFPKPV